LKRWSIPQEGLKIIACVSMLLDHIGAYLVPWAWLRMVGRLAFPLYCFLLVQGIAHTSSLRRYGMRLLLFAVISEVPYDLLKYGKLDFGGQNAIVTLLLGLCMIAAMKRTHALWKECAIAVTFAVAAALLQVEYGSFGIALIAVMYLMGEGTDSLLAVAVVLAAMGLLTPWTDGFPQQLPCVFAVLPMAAYSGKRLSANRWGKWAFYLFYPLHMAIIYFLGCIS